MCAMSVQTLLQTRGSLLLLCYLKREHSKGLQVLLHLNGSDRLVELGLVVFLPRALLMLRQFDLDLNQVLL